MLISRQYAAVRIRGRPRFFFSDIESKRLIRIRVGEEKSEASSLNGNSDLRRRLAAVCRAKKEAQSIACVTGK